MNRLLHDGVAHVGQEEAGDAVGFAVFEDAVPAAGVDARHKNGVVTLQTWLEALEGAVILQLVGDFIEPLCGLALHGAKALLIQLVAVNQKSPPSGVQAAEMGVHQPGPSHVQDQLKAQHGQEDPGGQQPVPAEGGHRVDQRQTEALGKKLTEHQGPDSGIAQQIGVVGPAEPVQQDAVSRGGKVVIPEAVAAHAAEGMITKEQPKNVKQGHGQGQMQQLCSL